MDPSRSERIQELFAAAIEHPAGEREAYVIDSVADLDLRAELLSLVKAHEGRGSLDSIAEHLASSASTEHVERLRAALRHRAIDRSRWYGPRVPRRGPQTSPLCGAQGPEARARPRARSRAVHARDRHRRAARTPQHPAPVRLRLGRRSPVLRDALRRRRNTAQPARP